MSKWHIYKTPDENALAAKNAIIISFIFLLWSVWNEREKKGECIRLKVIVSNKSSIAL